MNELAARHLRKVSVRLGEAASARPKWPADNINGASAGEGHRPKRALGRDAAPALAVRFGSAGGRGPGSATSTTEASADRPQLGIKE